MPRRLALLMLTAILVTAISCGSDESTVTSANRVTTTLPDDEAAFCGQWNAAMTASIASGDESALDAMLADVPAELQEFADILRQAERDAPASPEVQAAAAEVLDWAELHCERREAGESQR